MKCVRCGSKIKEEDRCCLKCGAINYNHPLNEKFASDYALKSEVLKSNPKLLKNKFNILYFLLFSVIIIVIVFVIGKFIG